MLKLTVIIGSTRPGRVGESVAKWVYELTKRRTEAEFELVDVKDFNLPLLDEAVNQMLDQLIAWSGALKTLRMAAP